MLSVFAGNILSDEFPGQAATANLEEPQFPKESRIGPAQLDDPAPVTIEKSNIMVIGPSGVGKTMMIKWGCLSMGSRIEKLIRN
jgi:ATP-dependent Clp protease ATP-binding subunit ClpX